MASISYSPLPSGKKRWIVNWYEPTLEGKSRMRRSVFSPSWPLPPGSSRSWIYPSG